MGKLRKSYPRFRRGDDAPTIELTADDTEILRRIHRYRFIKADDLYRLFPNRSPDRLARRLTHLFRSGYLDRPMAQIDRYRGGGSQHLVYGLGSVGAKQLKQLGLISSRSDWTQRNRSYTRENLDHTLAVSRFLIDIEIACAAREDLTFISIGDILARAPEATRRAAKPSTWSVAVQWTGVKAAVQLAPDAIFGLRQSRVDGRSRSAYFFVEIDRGTMTILPGEQYADSFLYRATILRKAKAYADSFVLGLSNDLFRIRAPRTLFITKSGSRAEAMRRACEQHVTKPLRLPPDLFLFGTAQTEPLGIYADSFGEPVKLVPDWKSLTGSSVEPDQV